MADTDKKIKRSFWKRVWEFFTGEINPDAETWEDYPRSMFGWLLSVFPKKAWKIIILVVSLAIGYGFFLLVSERSLGIDEKVRNRVEKEKIGLWDRSDDPAWKSALLNAWDKPDEVPLEIWSKAIEETDPEILIAMASNPWVPLHHKERLTVYEEDVRVRIAAILNRKNRLSAIKLLAKDKDEDLRLAVAKNEKTPSEVLKELAKDGNEWIRIVVAKNEKTPSEVLKELAKDGNAWVRLAVAEIKKAPSEVLKELAKDKKRIVREAPPENEKIPPELLKEWAKDGDVLLRQTAAKNEKTPSGLLKELAKDLDPMVRSAVAENSSTPFKILKRLTVDKDGGVRYEAIFTIISRPGKEWEKEWGK